MTQTVSQDEVYDALKTVYDPEIPVNVVDLGLIYDVQVAENNDVFVQMTLTFPGCGMGIKSTCSRCPTRWKRTAS